MYRCNDCHLPQKGKPYRVVTSIRERVRRVATTLVVVGTEIGSESDICPKCALNYMFAEPIKLEPKTMPGQKPRQVQFQGN